MNILTPRKKEHVKGERTKFEHEPSRNLFNLDLFGHLNQQC